MRLSLRDDLMNWVPALGIRPSEPSAKTSSLSKKLCRFEHNLSQCFRPVRFSWAMSELHSDPTLERIPTGFFPQDYFFQNIL